MSWVSRHAPCLEVRLSPIVWSNTLKKYSCGFKYGKIKGKYLSGLKLFILCLYPVTKWENTSTAVPLTMQHPEKEEIIYDIYFLCLIVICRTVHKTEIRLYGSEKQKLQHFVSYNCTDFEWNIFLLQDENFFLE
jgi:hypothetical protein